MKKLQKPNPMLQRNSKFQIPMAVFRTQSEPKKLPLLHHMEERAGERRCVVS